RDTGFLQFCQGNGVSTPCYQNNTALVAGKWYYIVVTRDGTNIKFYINNLIDATKKQNETPTGDSTHNVWIGWRNDSWSNGKLNGVLDDLRLYNYVRTQDEINLDYNAGLAASFGPTSADCDRDPGSCMTKNLAAYWSFDEGKGATTADISGNNNTGVFGGSPANPAWTNAGKVGGALKFNGVEADNVVIGDSNYHLFGTSNLNSGAVETWINPATTTAGDAPTSQSEWFTGEGGTVDFQLLFTTNGGQVGFNAWDRSVTSGSTVVPLNAWSHVVGTWGDFGVKIYVNGIEAGSTSLLATVATSTQDMYIGRKRTGYDYSGLIDEVKLYNRSLSAAEVRYHYNKGGPVGWWKFDEGSGTAAYDSSGKNNTGTLTNMNVTTATSSWVSGKYGTALSFDGVNDYVQVADSSNLRPGDAITISAWIKTGNYPGGTQGYIVRKGSEASGGADYAFSVSGSPGYLKFDFNNGGWQAGTADGSKAVTDNNWHFVTVTYNKANYTYYVDGVRGSSVVKTTAMATTTQNLYIGNDLTAYHFNGSIDDVKIYNYARTPDEIRLDYNAGMAAYFGPQTDCDRDPGSCMTKGLAGYWGMDEGRGTTATDISGNGNTGTLVGGPAWTNTGKVGGALSFDGTDDYVDAGNATPLMVSEGTIEFWAKFITHETGSIVDKNYTSGGYMAWIESATELRLYINSVGQAAIVPAPIGEWAHYAVRFSSSETVWFKNGVADTPGPGVIPTGNTNSVTIGKDTLNRYPQLVIDEVRIYNRALSVAEVRYHYNKGGPTAYWKFDEGSGSTSYDSSGNSNTGTLTNMNVTTATSSWSQGKYGTALNFDGVNDYVTVPNSSSTDLSGAITISAWINPSGWGAGGGYGHIAAKSPDSAVTTGYSFYVVTPGSLKFYANNGGIALTVPNVISLNQWQHVVVTYDKQLLKIFVNGALKGSVPYAAAITTNASAFLVGARAAGWYNFDGSIDDVRIYNYARSADQITQDYNGGKAMYFR
ncbi:MAG: LamG domain-containing protein, partial [bacterium]|nr:LamG domain-containing protein [bacterium]